MYYMYDHLTSPGRPVSRMSRVTVATCVATLHVTSGVSEMSHDLVQAPYRAITACMQGFWGLFDFGCMQYMLYDFGSKVNMVRNVQEIINSIFPWF